VRTEGIFLDVQLFDGRFGEYATNRVGELFGEIPGRGVEQLEVGVRDVGAFGRRTPVRAERIRGSVLPSVRIPPERENSSRTGAPDRGRRDAIRGRVRASASSSERTRAAASSNSSRSASAT